MGWVEIDLEETEKSRRDKATLFVARYARAPDGKDAWPRYEILVRHATFGVRAFHVHVARKIDAEDWWDETVGIEPELAPELHRAIDLAIVELTKRHSAEQVSPSDQADAAPSPKKPRRARKEAPAPMEPAPAPAADDWEAEFSK